MSRDRYPLKIANAGNLTSATARAFVREARRNLQSTGAIHRAYVNKLKLGSRLAPDDMVVGQVVTGSRDRWSR